MNIGENIRKYRLRKGLTQEMLASAVGVSGQAVSKWECGESIPDGMLFIPIADALEISLDRLCGYEKVYESDIYGAIMELISGTPEDEQIEKAREICWQVEKGLFLRYTAQVFGGKERDFGYSPDELSNRVNPSALSNNDGFTFISNLSGGRGVPFFSIFREPEDGFGSVLKYDEKYREFFEALSDEYVLKALFYIYTQEPQMSANYFDGHMYMFEKEALAAECGIPVDKIDGVVEKLRMVSERKFDPPREYEINGEKKILYTISQRYEIVALLAILNETIYHTYTFDLMRNYRSVPYLRDKRNGG